MCVKTILTDSQYFSNRLKLASLQIRLLTSVLSCFLAVWYCNWFLTPEYSLIASEEILCEYLFSLL